MRILTILKQVPDSNATIKVAADGKSVETTGIKLVMNPFDEFAVEQAVRFREQGIAVEEIVAMVIGGEKAAEVLRPALAMGADRGIHLKDELFQTHDELLLAEALSAGVKKTGPFDLILTGKIAIDMDAGEIGPALAEFLGIPHVGAVQGVDEISGQSAKLRRRVEGAEEIMETSLPALMTCEKGLCEPRYPSLPNLMKAKKKPVETLAASDLGIDLKPRSELLAMKPPAARKACKLVEGEPQQMAQELVRLLREEAKVV